MRGRRKKGCHNPIRKSIAALLWLATASHFPRSPHTFYLLVMSNVTLLPDHMLGEVIARTHDHDLLALLSSCKTFQRVLALDAKREAPSS